MSYVRRSVECGKRVAIVYHYYAHYRKGVMQELMAHGEHEYIFVGDQSYNEPSIEKWIVPPDATFLQAPCSRILGSFLFQQGVLRMALRRDIASIIYLGNAYFISTWISAAIARLTGKRVLFWTHGWTHQEGRMKAWFRRTFYRLAHGLLLYGHMAKSIGLREGFSENQLYVIYNSLDLESQQCARSRVTARHIQGVREEYFEHPERPLVVCSARLTAVCRFDMLLEAMGLLSREGHQVNALLIGDGPERARLEKAARDARLDVVFPGACYDEDRLAQIFMSANVTVSPGKVGLTAIHSLTYGTPVITHNEFKNQMPEWEAIIPGRSGDFFRNGDPADLARVIKMWTGSKYPNEEARAVCRDIVERFYNPHFQRIAIDRAVSGEPADDLFWQRSTSNDTEGGG